MNLTQTKKLIKAVFKRQLKTGERFSIEIVSGPGLGKSEGVAQVTDELAKELKEPFGFKPFFLSTLEQPDVRGFGLPVNFYQYFRNTHFLFTNTTNQLLFLLNYFIIVLVKNLTKFFSKLFNHFYWNKLSKSHYLFNK